ncbi:hypothetical protein J2S74_003581 [Evansella vedderi]|uniref:DUF3866 family protein n=1 Tax=Evansella vedderi TaxID=38282 RepID=A0ABU0A0D8_9BACI|nr:DUF3866 family protein [Evansella vedderi]MDQ0256163.1 hypothetical protein [Evansella vedderi]
MLTEEKVQVLNILEVTDEVLRIKTSGGIGKAILYRRLHPEVKVGDWVIVNTTATKLKLGTGGWDVVRAVIKKGNYSFKNVGDAGHIMKARYLSDQHSVLTVESPESKSHFLFKKRVSLNGKHIFICELHSMLPIIWFLLQLKKESTPLTVIFSDEASLPLVMSRHLTYLKKQPSFFSITAGQSFGGQKEAVNLVTALQYIVEQQLQGMVLITLGPGVVGSNTHYGFSGLAQANWANIIGALGGKPVWIPRLSEADPRERHKGVSHHTITPLTELTLMNSILPIPIGNYSNSLLERDWKRLTSYEHIEVKEVDEEHLFPQLIDVQELSPFPLTSMGRTIDKDPLFFLGVACAVHWFLEEEHHSSKV